MMRRADVEMRGSNNAVDTVNAAANAIASAESRVSPTTSKKARWGGFRSISCCFGSQNYNKRIGHAVFVPESTSSMTEVPPARILMQPPPASVPFAAPPSSPASFLPSGPPSTAHSPVGLPNMYSPGGPRSIFAVGPYANETQLVSPPIFSTFTTQPSTAPFTPPPESIHLTTPSSPEVPFASGDVGQRLPPSLYEFQMYQFYPRSPVGQLISPGSAISGSGTSSPFPDHDYYASVMYYHDIRLGVPPKLLNLQTLPSRDWRSHQGSGTVTPDAMQPRSRDGYTLDRQDSTISPLPSFLPDGHHYHEGVVDQRVSFELTVEDVVRCVEKGPKVLPKSLQIVDETPIEDASRITPSADEAERCQKQRSVSLGSINEFNFDSVNKEDCQKPSIGHWWANEKVSGSGKGGEQQGKHWSFFPVTEHGVNL